MDHDVVIIGAGPAGSTLASYLALEKVNVAIVEKEAFPRFKIGESLLPYSTEIFQEIGVYPKINSGKYINKFGAYFHDQKNGKNVYFDFTDSGRAKFQYSFEVLRSEFDQDLLTHAKGLGVDVFQPEKVEGIQFSLGKPIVKTQHRTLSAKMVIDASGRSSVLSQLMQIKKVENPAYNNNVAVFSHFSGVKRHSGKHEGDIIICRLIDDSWCWLIPLKGEYCSIGVVSPSKNLGKSADLSEFLNNAIESSDLLREFCEGAKMERPPEVVSNYSRSIERKIGPTWASIGDAGQFLDPVFSSGVHVSLMSAKLMAPIILKSLREGKDLDRVADSLGYLEQVDKGVSRFHKLLQIFYSGNFMEKVENILEMDSTKSAMISAVSGGMWEDDNILFRMGFL